MTNRREFLRSASVMAVTSMWATSCNSSTLSKLNNKKSFGLQLFSIRRELASDVPEGLRKIAEMGYSYIELFGCNSEARIDKVPLSEYKKYADDAGLKIVSSHLYSPQGVYDMNNFDYIKEFWKKMTDHHAAIGCKYIIQHGLPGRSTEEVAFGGEVLNEAGKIAKASGLIFGFHNAGNEFDRVVPGGTQPVVMPARGKRPPEGSKIIYDALIEATDPSLVVFQNDVYWTVMGRQDPVEYMRKYADRIRLLHIKDKAVLGQSGMMNFQKIFETAYSIGINEFFVELDTNTGYTQGSEFEDIKDCADYLLNADFVK